MQNYCPQLFCFPYLRKNRGVVPPQKCRRADILYLFSPNPRSRPSCFSITCALFHFPYHTYPLSFQYLPHSCPKNRGVHPLWFYQSRGFPMRSEHSASQPAVDSQLSTGGSRLTPFPATLTQKQVGTPPGHTTSAWPHCLQAPPHWPPVAVHWPPPSPFTAHSQFCYPTFTHLSPSLVTMNPGPGSHTYTMSTAISPRTVHFYQCEPLREMPS